MALLELSFAFGEDSLSVRRFSIQEGLSTLFTVAIWARSPNAYLDLEALVGQPVSFHVVSGIKFAVQQSRRWSGVVSFIEQVQAEPTGLSTYHLRIVPSFWLLTHRRNHRIFQHVSIPDIANKLFDEWGIDRTWKIDRGAYPKLEFKIQYGESDYIFLCRLFEEAGISFWFPEENGETKLTLGDNLHAAEPRTLPLPFVDNSSQAAEMEFVTQVRLAHEVRPGAFSIRDYDFRNPDLPLFGDAPKASAPEDRYEQYHYRPGGFLIERGAGGDSPVADDQGVARRDLAYGKELAERALIGARADKRHVNFGSNAIDLAAGTVFQIENHPHVELPLTQRLLITDTSFEGTHGEEWSVSGVAVFADKPFRPALRTPKPEVTAVQSATVVGPAGQEIHTDEFGRVRVQLPWDREGKSDEHSSCWMRVSQGWAGVGWGMITIPRIGQEVLVGFLGGDPDHPIIVGRVFNNTQRVPYKLPDHKTRSTWKSDTSPGSGGFNELMFEDLAGKELVYIQAQKNLRKLVKNDETITVGHNRQKLVKNNETETTGQDRMEVTGNNRTEITDRNRATVIGGDESKLVHGTEKERTEGDLLLRVGGDQHILIHQVKRELVVRDSHIRVRGNCNEQIDQTKSLSAGGLQIKVGGKHALEAAEEIHVKAGTALVIEAAQDLTIKGPGGFIRIDAGGVTIKGTMVKINSGGSAGSGSGAYPNEPEDPVEAKIEEPERPVPDDVSKSGLAQ
jgi:type VI secretion system secreted protein VgrG